MCKDPAERPRGENPIEGSRVQLARNVKSNYAARAVGFTSGFILIPVILSHVGINNFGLWALSTAVFGYSGLLEMGVSGAITKYVAQHRGEKDEEALQRSMAAALTLALAGGLFAASFLVVLYFVGPAFLQITASEAETFRALMAILAVRALFAFAFALPEATLKGFERYDLTSGVTATAHVLTLVVSLYLLYSGHGIVELALLSLLVPAFVAAANTLSLGRVAPLLHWALSRHPIRTSPDLFRFSAGWMGLSVATVAMYQADYLVLATFLSTAAIGVYGVVAKLNNMMREFDWLTVQSIIPLASRLKASDDKERSDHLLELGTRYHTALEYTIVGTVIIFAGPFLLAWVGAAFAPWIWLTQVFLSYYLLNPSLSVSNSVLTGQGKVGVLLRATYLTAAVNVALSVALTWYLRDVSGVIFGTVFASIAVYPYWLLTLSKAIGTPPRRILAFTARSYVGAAVAVGVGLLFTAFVPSGSLLVVVAGMALSVACGVGAYARLFLHPDERALILKELLGRRGPSKNPPRGS